MSQLTGNAPTGSLRGRRVAAKRINRPGRLIGAGLLVTAAAALALWSDAAIALEAQLVAGVLSAFTSGGTSSVGHLIWTGIGTESVHGFLITPVCTSLVLIGPILVLTGVLVLLGRKRADWTLLGGALALAVAVGANTLRFILIATAWQLWGEVGFDIMHYYAGSVLVILASALAIVLLLVVSSTGRLQPPRRWLASIRGRGAAVPEESR